jgi:hypothetical protein
MADATPVRLCWGCSEEERCRCKGRTRPAEEAAHWEAEYREEEHATSSALESLLYTGDFPDGTFTHGNIDVAVDRSGGGSKSPYSLVAVQHDGQRIVVLGCESFSADTVEARLVQYVDEIRAKHSLAVIRVHLTRRRCHCTAVAWW